MPAADHRLTSPEVARFVAEGFLRFDALVPDALNRRAVEAMRALTPAMFQQAVGRAMPAEALPRPASGTPLSRCYPAPSPLGELIRLPAVAGILESLVGPDPLYDHDFIHFLPAGSGYRQHLHVDAIVDTPDPGFDVQLFYFPVAVEPGGGGTRFVPGSHLRRVRAEDVARYQHVLGEQQFSGPAGTVMVFHHGLWHAGQPNPGASDRWLYKIRVGPAGTQARRWNTDDLEGFQNPPTDHVFATMEPDNAATVLRGMQPWQLGHEARYELVERARLWRYLCADDRYDVDYYLTRLEGRARRLAGR